MPNYASMLGEAIGHLIEAHVHAIVRDALKDTDCYVDTGGARPGKRKGKKALLVNDTGNNYQIDTVVENREGDYIALIECKYIRYKKHNRDKASWTCVAHYKLRTTYPTVRKSIAVLIGDWTAPSKRLMQSFGINIIEIPFNVLSNILSRHGVEFKWEEGDTDTPKESMSNFLELGPIIHKEIAVECLSSKENELKELVLSAVTNQEEIIPRSVEKIELLIKTNQEEYVLKKFTDTSQAMTYLLSLMNQKADVGNIAKGGNSN